MSTRENIRLIARDPFLDPRMLLTSNISFKDVQPREIYI